MQTNKIDRYGKLLLQFNTALKDPKIAAEMNFIVKLFSSMMEIIREYLISQFVKKIELPHGELSIKLCQALNFLK